MNQKENINHKGFTLLELLIVVLIIGILATIALPQYKMAVGKVKFLELKSLTKTVAESSQRYFLANGVYPSKYEDLDIEIDMLSNPQSEYNSNYFSFKLSNGVSCTIWRNNDDKIACYKKILGKTMSYYIDRRTFKPLMCLVYSKDSSDNANRLCQKETGKKTATGESTYNSYNY